MRSQVTGMATLIVALGGAALAALFAMPAGPLIGALLAVAILCALGLKAQVSIIVRDCAYLVIGVSLGAGIDASVVGQLPQWSLSLSILAISLVMTMAVSSWLLMRSFGFDQDTAVLASSPGTMSNVLAMAAEGRGDATPVMILQLIRLGLLVTFIPPITTFIKLPEITIETTRSTMPLLGLICLLALGLPLGRWLSSRGVPAACLLVGLVLSAGVHISGVINGAAPPWLIFAAFSATGAVIGMRIGVIPIKSAIRLLGAGITVVLAVMLISLCFAYIAHILTHLPVGMVLVAYAPGGVEAMAAIGIALGYDPAYIAAHHFARIFILIGLVPLFLKR